jgi:hypothetical protein
MSATSPQHTRLFMCDSRVARRVASDAVGCMRSEPPAAATCAHCRRPERKVVLTRLVFALVLCRARSVCASESQRGSSELEKIFSKHGTDKQKAFHNYAPVYSAVLESWRRKSFSLLEVGLGSVNNGPSNMQFWLPDHPAYRPGASLRAWSDYFPNASLYGLDVDEQAVRQLVGDPRIEAFTADSTKPAQVADVLRHKAPFDIIIDDGLHTWSAQQRSLVVLWRYLRPGGYYFMEDVTLLHASSDWHKQVAFCCPILSYDHSSHWPLGGRWIM